MIIGICGQINTGKSTVADILCDEYNFISISFADHLKDFCLQMFPGILDEETLWGSSDKRTPDVRWLLQHLGTDVARRFDPNVWIKHTLQRIKKIQKTGTDPLGRIKTLKPPYSIVVPDIRFPNEAQKLRKLPAYLLQISRPNNYDLVATKASARTHKSEPKNNDISSDLFFTNIQNNGTLEALHQKVHEILEVLRLVRS